MQRRRGETTQGQRTPPHTNPPPGGEGRAARQLHPCSRFQGIGAGGGSRLPNPPPRPPSPGLCPALGSSLRGTICTAAISARGGWRAGPGHEIPALGTHSALSGIYRHETMPRLPPRRQFFNVPWEKLGKWVEFLSFPPLPTLLMCSLGWFLSLWGAAAALRRDPAQPAASCPWVPAAGTLGVAGSSQWPSQPARPAVGSSWLALGLRVVQVYGTGQEKRGRLGSLRGHGWRKRKRCCVVCFGCSCPPEEPGARQDSAGQAATEPCPPWAEGIPRHFQRDRGAGRER